jgi:hypothetical protein
MTEYFDVAVCQIRAGPAESSLSGAQPTTVAPRALESDELTILTGWAQALSEALVYDRESVEALLAHAQGNSPWRAKLGIPDPSPQLSKAIYFIGKGVRAVASLNGDLTLNAVHISLLEDGSAEDALDRLARRVLRSTLEQVALNRV